MQQPDETIERKRRLLAGRSEIGPDAATAMFESVVKRYQRFGPERLTAEVDVLLAAHGIDDPNAEPPEAPPAVPVATVEAEPDAAAQPQPAPSSEAAPVTDTVAPDAADNYVTGGFAKVPNLFVTELMPAMSAPLVKAYVYCCRIAKRDGAVQVSHAKLAQAMGCRARYARHVGLHAMTRLLKASLLHQETKGGPGKTSTYRLVALSSIDLERARAVTGRPERRKDIVTTAVTIESEP